MIRPLGDRVLILPDKVDEITEYGIYVPDSVGVVKGEVLAIGESDKIKVKVGDRVLLPGARLEIKEKGKYYCVVRYEQLDVVFDKDE